MQNHGGWEDRPGIGVLRSDDSGQTWRSIANGLPSDFGFPIVVHPHNPDVVYVVPLKPMTRTCPGGVPAVWRSENGGSSWKRLVKGLPKKDSYFTILRDAMTTTNAQLPPCTLARQPAKYGWDAMASKNGVVCSTHFHPFIVLRPQWFDERVQVEHTEGKKRMIFRAYASKNPGVWGGLKEHCLHRAETTEIANLQFLRFCYSQVLRPSLTPFSSSSLRRK